MKTENPKTKKPPTTTPRWPLSNLIFKFWPWLVGWMVGLDSLYVFEWRAPFFENHPSWSNSRRRPNGKVTNHSCLTNSRPAQQIYIIFRCREQFRLIQRRWWCYSMCVTSDPIFAIEFRGRKLMSPTITSKPISSIHSWVLFSESPHSSKRDLVCLLCSFRFLALIRGFSDWLLIPCCLSSRCFQLGDR